MYERDIGAKNRTDTSRKATSVRCLIFIFSIAVVFLYCPHNFGQIIRFTIFLLLFKF